MKTFSFNFHRKMGMLLTLHSYCTGLLSGSNEKTSEKVLKAKECCVNARNVRGKIKEGIANSNLRLYFCRRKKTSVIGILYK